MLRLLGWLSMHGALHLHRLGGLRDVFVVAACFEASVTGT